MATYHNGLTICLIDKVVDQYGCPDFERASGEDRCVYRVRYSETDWRCDCLQQQQAALLSTKGAM
jgi:hypothetical protein